MFTFQDQVEIRLPAEILTAASSNRSKRNGATYVLHTCKILDGPLKDQEVTGQRTIVNKDGEICDGVAVGDKVELAPNVSADGQKIFYEIFTSRPATISDAEAIRLLFGRQPKPVGDDTPKAINGDY